MKKRSRRIVPYTVGVLVIASSLLLMAQTKQVKKQAKKAEPKPATVAHPFGPANIEVNFATCQLQQTLIHADPQGKVIFSSVNATGPVKVDITKDFLSVNQVTIPQNGVAPPVTVNAPSGTGKITIEGCTPSRKGKKGGVLSDPNEIIVP